MYLNYDLVVNKFQLLAVGEAGVAPYRIQSSANQELMPKLHVKEKINSKLTKTFKYNLNSSYYNLNGDYFVK